MSLIDSQVREDTLEWEEHLLLDGKQDPQVSGEIDVRNTNGVTLYVLGTTPPVNGGTVLLEGSPISGYAGTWVSLGSCTPSGTALKAASVIHGDNGFPCRFVRVRISTQIANGAIDAYIVTQR